MILCVDAGNTRLKYGLHDGQDWRMQTALPREELTGANFDWLDRLLDSLPAVPTRLVACSVAGEYIQSAIETLAGRLGLRSEWLRSQASGHGVHNGYARPAQLGNDRWAALIAARRVCPEACVVVMAGTATTIDALAGDGRFLGGLILPGLSLMRQSLARGTAQLPVATGRYQPWPSNTDDAIVSGSVLATTGAIDRLRRQLGATEAAVSCVLSGGAAEALRDHIDGSLIWQPELVLEGLAHLAHGVAS